MRRLTCTTQRDGKAHLSQMMRWHVTRLLVMLGVILLPMTVPVGNASAANGPVAETTRPVASKKPVVLTIDGICFTATISIVLNQTCWTDYLKDAFSSALADDYHVASSPWTGDPKETPKILSFAEKTIRGYSEVAKRRGQPFQIIAHSWGSVLAYVVLKNNPGIQVATLITLGSPLQSQDKIVVEKYTGRYAGTTILKPGNVERWVNYWAWNDLISGSIDVADKNVQLDGQQSRTDYETRLAATLDFHSQYYSAWKSSIIADLSPSATSAIVIPTECTTIKNQDYSRRVTLVTTPWIQLNRGQASDDYSFSSDGSLFYRGHMLAHNLIVSGTSDQWIYAQSVALSPKSPSGRFAILQACEESDLKELCRMFVIDHGTKAIGPILWGRYGPERWVAWVAALDEYAVLRDGNYRKIVLDLIHLPTRSFMICFPHVSPSAPLVE